MLNHQFQQSHAPGNESIGGTGLKQQQQQHQQLQQSHQLSQPTQNSQHQVTTLNQEAQPLGLYNDNAEYNSTREANGGSYSNSPSPTASGDGGNQGSFHVKFKRNYRACLNCRVRKVKCDLGPVDNPREGKCARCLRERKDCVFVESKRGGAANVVNGRKRRKRSDAGTSDGSSRRKSELSVDTSVSSTNDFVDRSSNTNTSKLKQPTSFSADQSPYSSPQSYNQSRLPSVTNILNKGDNGDQSTQPRPSQAPLPVQEKPETDNSDPNTAKNSGPSNHFSTMEGALVFLAKAAGTIAKADERDNIDARAKHEQLEARIRRNSHGDSSEMSSEQDINNIPVSSSTNAAAGSNNISNILNANSSASSLSSALPTPTLSAKQSSSNIPAYIKPSTEGRRMAMPAAENGYAVRPRASNKLSSIEYIGGVNGILSEVEAERLIHLFFTTMHPYFPHLPKFLHSPKVLSGYPILLCAILTIASRYHPFENNVGTTGGVPRNIEVHDRLWLYVQRLISQTVWAEASTRSIGTIFAFLLFTEWNPRAIHWRWSDYANKAEENNDTDSGFTGFGVGGGSNGGGDDVTGDRNSDEPNMAGLGAMRRSYRMAWMLIGSSVRLAQDMGFMEISSKTFIATHVAEINSVMNISRSSMLAHSLAEVDLDEDEITEEDMEQVEDDDDKILRMSEDDLKRLASQHILKFTLSQKAQIELLQIISLGHESLYGYKAQLGNLTQRQNLSILNIISPLINNWGRKYKQYLVASNSKLLRNVSNLQQHWLNPNSKVCKEIAESIERESFIFEFNYVKLYIYSLALSPSSRAMYEQRKNKKGRVTLKLDEISKSAKYIEQAFKAANEMLYVAHRVHRLKMLRYMPVRWLTRMVRAVAFIVKCYLTITAHKNSAKGGSSLVANSMDNFDSTILSLSLISIDDIIQSIQRAAITLRDCSPDELHLCTRYSNVLMYLCSEMKTKSKGFHDDSDNDVESYGDGRQKGEEQMKYPLRSEYGLPGSDTTNMAQKIDSDFPASKPMSYNEGSQDPQHQGQLQQQLQQQQARPLQNLQGVQFTNTSKASPAGDNYGSRDYFETQRSTSNISQSESMTPNDSNTPLQGLIGDSEVMEFFMNNKNIGLDFVGPWTEMIEQQLNLNEQFNFNDAL